MKVAILCPGPSVSHFDGPDGYAQIIGVNRAATLFRCDVWAAGDFTLIEKTREHVIGTPSLLTSKNGDEWMRENLKPWSGMVETFEKFYDGNEKAYLWPTFTGTAAVWCAASKGATLIRVFGADWRGKQDFDGVEAGCNREESRWKLESQIFNNISGYWSAKNIRIERVIL